MDSRWLTGGRDSGNTKVSTTVLKGNSKVNTFIWTVRSNYQIADPKRGQCLRYGDTIYLQVKSRDNRWLTRARNKGNKDVRTRNVIDEVKVASTYAWVVRSNNGTGMLDIAGSGDPGHGECLSDLSQIFLQNKGQDYRWLSGSRNGGNNGVGTFNCLKNEDESVTNVGTYKFIIRKDSPGTGIRTDALQCDYFHPKGKWVALSFNNANIFTLEFETAVTQNKKVMNSTSITEPFSKIVTSRIEAGFSYEGVSGGASQSVTGSESKSTSSTIEEAFERTLSERTSMSFEFD